MPLSIGDRQCGGNNLGHIGKQSPPADVSRRRIITPLAFSKPLFWLIVLKK
jgi:hypothetical protein